MASRKPVVIDDLLNRDRLATLIAEKYISWENLRQAKETQWKELTSYIFATDTTYTSNNKLPWSNKTTLPKLCQIRDNLFANYMASLFPKRKWLQWEGESREDESITKRKAIESYMTWVTDRNEFYDEVAKMVYDYIDYGNVICMPDWKDSRIELEDANGPQIKGGYVGPVARRISPLDIVFDPTANSFEDSPKIIRSLVSIGEVKEYISSLGNTPEEQQKYNDLFNYMKEFRAAVSQYPSTNTISKDRVFEVSGFGSYHDYLASNTVELLTFYGNIYDEDHDIYHRNVVIIVADRHKVMCIHPNPSWFGEPPIYHSGWRVRQDNLWAMGPLDNLVGMQYRIDHLENIKADVFDLIAFPVLKIKGYVEDFEWAPFTRIYVGDSGDVEMLSPDVNALQADTQIAILEAKMEEMAGAPKEALGFRSPGEKTKYEVQRLENAASRIFQSKIAQFERQILERLLNAMLELARRKMDTTTVRIFDENNKIPVFKDISREDVVGMGRIKPMAARHFAEQANLLQNLNSFFSSPVGQDQSVLQHFSSEKLARLFESLLEIDTYKIVEPYIRITEQGESQRQMNVTQESTAMETLTPSGLAPEDSDGPIF